MSLYKAVEIGCADNELSKDITDTDEASAERSAVATDAGAAVSLAAVPMVLPWNPPLGIRFIPGLFD